MGYTLDIDTEWQHCGRPAEVVDCSKDLDDCGHENCHAIYCTKCSEQLATFDCMELDTMQESALESLTTSNDEMRKQ